MFVSLAPELLRAAQVASSSGVPILQIAGPIIVVAIAIISQVNNQVEKAKKDVEELKEIVKKYDDLRQVRGEQREVLIRALGTIDQTVERASRLLPQVAHEHERRVQAHHSELFSFAESVARIHAQYDEAVRFEQDMIEAAAIAERIKASKIEDSFVKFGENLKILLKYLKTQKEA